jgi:hypothetical protein
MVGPLALLAATLLVGEPEAATEPRPRPIGPPKFMWAVLVLERLEFPERAALAASCSRRRAAGLPLEVSPEIRPR